MTAAPGTEEYAANLALGHLGQLEIAAMSDTTLRARKARLFFPAARDEMLRRKDWNFSTTWATPAMDPTPSVGHLKNRFPLPTDCIRVRFVRDVPSDAWAVETVKASLQGAQVDTKVLVTNALSPIVCYTRRVEQVQLWDSLFLTAFAKLLASYMAVAVGRSQSTAKEWAAKAQAELDDAATVDAKEQSNSRARPSTSWQSSRQRPSYSRRRW